MLDKETVRQIAANYVKAVTHSLSPTKIILFGSHINGTPNELSDIDIAVVMDGFEGDWLETASLLYRLRKGVSIDIEPHLMDEQHDQSGFLEHIMKTGEIIYAA